MEATSNPRRTYSVRFPIADKTYTQKTQGLCVLGNGGRAETARFPAELIPASGESGNSSLSEN